MNTNVWLYSIVSGLVVMRFISCPPPHLALPSSFPPHTLPCPQLASQFERVGVLRGSAEASRALEEAANKLLEHEREVRVRVRVCFAET